MSPKREPEGQAYDAMHQNRVLQFMTGADWEVQKWMKY